MVICKSAEAGGVTGVFVGGGFGVTVADGGGKYICVFVGGITTTTHVFVATAVSVGTGVPVFGGTDGILVAVLVGRGVRVANTAPGVKYPFNHTGLVRMAGSRGSIKLTG